MTTSIVFFPYKAINTQRKEIEQQHFERFVILKKQELYFYSEFVFGQYNTLTRTTILLHAIKVVVCFVNKINYGSEPVLPACNIIVTTIFFKICDISFKNLCFIHNICRQKPDFFNQSMALCLQKFAIINYSRKNEK